MDCLPTALRVTAMLVGRVLADTGREILLFEIGLPARPDIPLDDVATRSFSAPSRP